MAVCGQARETLQVRDSGQVLSKTFPFRFLSIALALIDFISILALVQPDAFTYVAVQPSLRSIRFCDHHRGVLTWNKS